MSIAISISTNCSLFCTSISVLCLFWCRLLTALSLHFISQRLELIKDSKLPNPSSPASPTLCATLKWEWGMRHATTKVYCVLKQTLKKGPIKGLVLLWIKVNKHWITLMLQRIFFHNNRQYAVLLTNFWWLFGHPWLSSCLCLPTYSGLSHLRSAWSNTFKWLTFNILIDLVISHARV